MNIPIVLEAPQGNIVTGGIGKDKDNMMESWEEFWGNDGGEKIFYGGDCNKCLADESMLSPYIFNLSLIGIVCIDGIHNIGVWICWIGPWYSEVGLMYAISDHDTIMTIISPS